MAFQKKKFVGFRRSGFGRGLILEVIVRDQDYKVVSVFKRGAKKFWEICKTLKEKFNISYMPETNIDESLRMDEMREHAQKHKV